ncbi:hypothetical protein PLESTB_001509800 [Pleodorina starrii]|uniref:Major facilitator superfamily (MFS) profile domain-containing protein n=1 Tax=Pleodorina starrii TaxID=330485 RepID=A0A9W6BWZ7_9CHLO|nr:hypothetical protein PLESTM_000843800 [Pleodorina starrii]GLC59628.1 hypothetical protein PLESTB_001509800 [Pleodorina starrii]GLC76056.1 hypothetical protein PLESTF_001729400 [Pleodorina starrii]
MSLSFVPSTQLLTSPRSQSRKPFPDLYRNIKSQPFRFRNTVKHLLLVAASSCARAVGPLPSTLAFQPPCFTTRWKLLTAYDECTGRSLRHGRTTAGASRALMPSSSRYGSPASRPQPWQVVSAVCAVAMLLCNFHRSVFTALLPLVAGSLALTPAEVGLLQSSMLWGYLAGQIPAGRLADERGGDRVLLGGLALWSLATAATSAAAAAASPSAALVTLLVARAAMGLFSSVIMPAVSAATAQWVPPERKAATLAMIYAFFNVGGVLGLVVAPHLATRGGGSGWPAAFVTAATGGVLWSVLGSAIVARAGARPPLPSQLRNTDKRQLEQQQQQQQGALLPQPGELQPQQGLMAAEEGAPTVPSAAASTDPAAVSGLTAATAAARDGVGEAEAQRRRVASLGDGASTSGRGSETDPWVAAATGDSTAQRRRATLVQVAALCWCHGVIGWGFFVLQSWVPMYLQSLGVADLASAGLLASLPWLAAAFTATAAGGLADRLVRSGRTTRLAVRRGMHAVSTLGCAVAVLPLAAAPGGSLPPLVATLCLVAAVGCYGFSFGGFHAYVQDVAAADAGQLLGLTNTASILGGIAGNLATGAVLQATGGYGAVFWVAVALYGTSWIVFQRLLQGEPVALASLARA